jgi:outer membrane receptor for ferrienterochelin and colicins
VKKLAFNLILLAAVISGILAPQTAVGQPQQPDSIKSFNLDEVVVTGQYEPQSVDKSVYRVRTIPMERIKARGAVLLQDVLNTELNIRFEQDQALGTSNMYIQGLSGQNVKLLIDGIPQVGRQSTDNSFNINQVNVNSIERIEIIEGPMSVIYGADALAGVINIITKKSPDGKLDLNGRIHEENVGKEYDLDRGIHNESVGVAYAKNKFNTRVDFSRNIFGGFKGDSTGREEAWHPKKQYLGDALVGYSSDKSRVYYRIDYLFEDIYNPANFVSGSALDQNYISKRLMHQLQGAHTFTDKLSFNGAFAYTNYSRRTRTTTVDEATGDVRLSLGDGQQDVTTFDGTTFRGTFQYKINNKFMIQPGVDLNREVGEGGRLMQGAHPIGDYAFFLSSEWSVVRKIQLRPGIRMTHNTKYDAPPVMPSLNAKIGINDKQDLRLSYGRGFRAPSLRELYFDFVDASHNIKGNPNLKAELSNSFNGSWNWQVIEVNNNKVTTAVGGFYNDIRNQINYASLNNAASYINIDRYKTKGVTWTNTFRNRNWDVSAGFSYTGRFNQLHEGGDDSPEFTWAPEVTSTASYRTNNGGWVFSAYYKYTGKLPFAEPVTVDGQQTIHIAKLNSYQWSDVSVQKELFKSFNVTAGVRNLFNIKSIGSTSLSSGSAHGGGNTRPIGSGRAYFIDLTYTFNQ